MTLRRLKGTLLVHYLVRFDMRTEIELQGLACLEHLLATSLNNSSVHDRSWGRYILQIAADESGHSLEVLRLTN